MSNVNVKRVKSSEIEFKDKLVSIQRVTKVTKGGRTFSFSAIVVVGNENGVVGYGLGKAKEVTAAIAKGIDDAKKNLIKVPILKGTLPHEQIGKYSGARVFLKPAAGVPCWTLMARHEKTPDSFRHRGLLKSLTPIRLLWISFVHSSLDK